jgi:hypothetical protein
MGERMKLNINKKLVKAIAKSGLDFEDIAIFAGIYSNEFVYMIQGKKTPDKEIQQRIATVLGKKPEELFEYNKGT